MKLHDVITDCDFVDITLHFSFSAEKRTRRYWSVTLSIAFRNDDSGSNFAQPNFLFSFLLALCRDVNDFQMIERFSWRFSNRIFNHSKIYSNLCEAFNLVCDIIEANVSTQLEELINLF